MSLNNYTNIGTTAEQFAALKNQVRKGKVFSFMTKAEWTTGSATWNTSGSADFDDFFSVSTVQYRVKADDSQTWGEYVTNNGELTYSNNTLTLAGAAIDPELSHNVLVIEVNTAIGYMRLATANTWNQLNTAIKSPLSTAGLSHAAITANDTYTIRLGDLTGYTASDYIGIDEDTVLTFTVNVPTAGAAVINTKTISDLTYVSATASDANYNLSLTGDLAVTFSTYGMVTSDISGNDLATSLTLPKLTVNSTPSISNNTASFNATNNGFITSGTTALTLNCYAGALEE